MKILDTEVWPSNASTRNDMLLIAGHKAGILKKEVLNNVEPKNDNTIALREIGVSFIKDINTALDKYFSGRYKINKLSAVQTLSYAIFDILPELESEHFKYKYAVDTLTILGYLACNDDSNDDLFYGSWLIGIRETVAYYAFCVGNEDLYDVSTKLGHFYSDLFTTRIIRRCEKISCENNILNHMINKGYDPKKTMYRHSIIYSTAFEIIINNSASNLTLQDHLNALIFTDSTYNQNFNPTITNIINKKIDIISLYCMEVADIFYVTTCGIRYQLMNSTFNVNMEEWLYNECTDIPNCHSHDTITSK